MNPQEAQTTTIPAHVTRFVFCGDYGKCLDLAVFLGWQSWTCAFCAPDGYQRPTWQVEELLEDSARCRFLWANVDQGVEETGSRHSQIRASTAAGLLLNDGMDFPDENY